jgi:hypothetical protein
MPKKSKSLLQRAIDLANTPVNIYKDSAQKRAIESQPLEGLYKPKGRRKVESPLPPSYYGKPPKVVASAKPRAPKINPPIWTGSSAKPAPKPGPASKPASKPKAKVVASKSKPKAKTRSQPKKPSGYFTARKGTTTDKPVTQSKGGTTTSQRERKSLFSRIAKAATKKPTGRSSTEYSDIMSDLRGKKRKRG